MSVIWRGSPTCPRFSGHSVGETARRLNPCGVIIDSQGDLRDALAAAARHIQAGTRLLFEPAFEYDGVLVRVDILKRATNGYELREVKAAGSVKDYHLQDAAIQAWVVQNSGLRVESVVIQHIDTSFVYPGGGDYRGLFAEKAVMALTMISNKYGRSSMSAMKPLINAYGPPGDHLRLSRMPISGEQSWRALSQGGSARRSRRAAVAPKLSA